MTQTKLNSNLGNQEWVLMAKALRGELTEKEQLEFSGWLDEDESHLQQWTEALEIWDEVGTAQVLDFQPNVDLAWEQLSSKLELYSDTKIIPLIPAESSAIRESVYSATLDNIPVIEPALVGRKISLWNSLYKYAAAFVLAAGLAWLGYLQLNSSSDWAMVATATGERQLITLPDGSQVTLNENSTLRYQTAFNGPERQVELEGEGFFEVQKNPEQPFIVKSGEAQTKVLGTSFNIRALKAEPEVSVTVITGKVALSDVKEQQQVVLTPGYTGILSSDGQLNKKNTEETVTLNWKSLVFNNTPMKNVVQQLQQYFHVSIDVANQKLLQCTFTGTFDNPELKEIMSVLGASSDIKIESTEAGTYTFDGAGCQ